MSGKWNETGLDRARAELDRLARPNTVGDDQAAETYTIDRELDVRGEICPYPVDAALAALAQMQPGQILAELTDHTIATHTVPAAVQRAGIAKVLRIEEQGGGLYRIILQRI